MSPSELPTHTPIASGQKVGVVGVGAVGSACAYSLLLRHSCAEIVLVDRDVARAIGVAADMRYGTLHGRPIVIRAGGYEALEDAGVVLVTAGVNERDGGATDRNDADGRLRLVDTNAGVYRDIVPQIVAVAPGAVIVVVTDPPDPLADLARVLAGHDRVLSTGTLLDSNRFRLHIAAQLEVDPASVDAQVVGEHGTSQVRLWSSATVAGVPVETALARRHGEDAVAGLRAQIDEAVLHANITIIEGIGASQYGIGVASARIAEGILGAEHVVRPVAAPARAPGRRPPSRASWGAPVCWRCSSRRCRARSATPSSAARSACAASASGSARSPPWPGADAGAPGRRGRAAGAGGALPGRVG